MLVTEDVPNRPVMKTPCSPAALPLWSKVLPAIVRLVIPLPRKLVFPEVSESRLLNDRFVTVVASMLLSVLPSTRISVSEISRAEVSLMPSPVVFWIVPPLPASGNVLTSPPSDPVTISPPLVPVLLRTMPLAAPLTAICWNVRSLAPIVVFWTLSPVPLGRVDDVVRAGDVDRAAVDGVKPVAWWCRCRARPEGDHRALGVLVVVVEVDALAVLVDRAREHDRLPPATLRPELVTSTERPGPGLARCRGRDRTPRS